MQSSLYVSLSAEVALQKRLDTIANNVANASTAGFRAEEVKFDSVLSRVAADPVAFASTGKSYISREAGGVTKTDNPLDVAVDGDGWLAVRTPAGPVYTRDGRPQVSREGQLETLAGDPVLDAGRLPIGVDPEGGPLAIARDGMVSQGGNAIGAIGLFRIEESADLRRYGNSGVIPDRVPAAMLDFTQAGLAQGYVEGSNVNPIKEMTRMMMVQHAFEAANGAIQASEQSLQDAIRTLGAPS